MNTKTLVAIVVIIAVAVLGYLYYTKWRGPNVQENIGAIENAEEAANAITESATQGTLPSLETPDTNPVSKTNPFSNVKTNPFE